MERLDIQAGNALIEEIERLARKILKEHSSLNEFIMGMGTIFFTKKEDKKINYYNIIELDQYGYLLPLKDLIKEYDDIYHLTGELKRFTAKGEKITDW